MAIVDEVPGLEVTVDIDGSSLQEHIDWADDSYYPIPREKTRFVEATSDAEFGIAVQYDPQDFPFYNDHITYRLYVDGKRVHGLGVHHDPRDIDLGRRIVVDHARETLEGSVIIKRFTFAELKINEDPADESLRGKLHDLGTITVQAHRMEQVPERPPVWAGKRMETAIDENAPLLVADEIPEKNLKGQAISHQTRMNIRQIAPLRKATRYYDWNSGRMQWQGERYPFATFHFKYRSRRALQSLLMIPRTPSPAPSGDSAVRVLTVQELNDFKARQADPRRRGGVNTTVKREIKRERSPSPEHMEIDGWSTIIKRPKKALRHVEEGPKEVIDLCALSDGDMSDGEIL